MNPNATSYWRRHIVAASTIGVLLLLAVLLRGWLSASYEQPPKEVFTASDVTILPNGNLLRIRPTNSTWLTPLPTESLDVTPAADQSQVRVSSTNMHLGAATETAAPATSLTQARVHTTGQIPGEWRAFITDADGIERQLGNNTGDAKVLAQNDNVVAWGFTCLQCTEAATNTTFQTGLYLYNRATHQNKRINDIPPDLSDPQLTNNWMLYFVDPNAQEAGNTARPVSGSLRAYNLTTEKDMLVADDLEFTNGISGGSTTRPRDLYAVSDTSVIWSAQQQLHLYDLNTRTAQLLTTPPMSQPYLLSISDRLIVWLARGQGWWVYDRITNTAAPISSDALVPPAWNGRTQAGAPLRAVGDQVIWSLKVDGQERYLTASLIRGS